MALVLLSGRGGIVLCFSLQIGEGIVLCFITCNPANVPM